MVGHAPTPMPRPRDTGAWQIRILRGFNTVIDFRVLIEMRIDRAWCSYDGDCRELALTGALFYRLVTRGGYISLVRLDTRWVGHAWIRTALPLPPRALSAAPSSMIELDRAESLTAPSCAQRACSLYSSTEA